MTNTLGVRERAPRLWDPPDPERESPHVWRDAGALEDGLFGDETGKTNSQRAEKCFACQLAIEEFQHRTGGRLTISSILSRRS
jgi:hypothetical protein